MWKRQRGHVYAARISDIRLSLLTNARSDTYTAIDFRDRVPPLIMPNRDRVDAIGCGKSTNVSTVL